MPPTHLRFGSLDHPVGSRTLVMGILNVTPDSFSDGARFAAHEAAIAHGRRMIEEGADIVDIGGESTRPNAVEVPQDEEVRRIVPVIEALAGLPVPISVDTSKAAVAEAAIRAGAAIVNDVFGLQRDPGLAVIAAEHEAGVVAMHHRAHDRVDASLDMVEEVLAFLGRSVAIALRAGIREDRFVLDPGIGFGKSQAQNLDLLRALPRLRQALGFPILLGVSRKSSIGRIIDKPVGERLFGSIAANVVAVAGGVDIVRVHDVGPHVDAVRVADAIVRGGQA